MKFYQSNLFEKSNINTSISAIFENLSSLYPNKDIKTEQIIDKQLLNEKNNRSMKLISVITKELVNNVYKHSDATYLIYMLFKEGDSVIIEINSDGANIEDFKNIKESRRGVLLLNLLIDSNSGNIEYKLNDNVLSTRVVLEWKFFLLDDHKIFGQSLKQLLKEQDDIELCDYISSIDKLFRRLKVEKYDILLIDINLKHKITGLELIEKF